MGFWSKFGKGALAVAKWSLTHDEYIEAALTLTGHPVAAGAVKTGVNIIEGKANHDYAPTIGPKEAPSETPVVPVQPVQAAQEPQLNTPIVANTDIWAAKWRQFIIDAYRNPKPDGLNRYPTDDEIKSDAENIEKYGQAWLLNNLRQRNGA